MRVGRLRQAEQPSDDDLPRRRVQQVVAADDLADALRRVVDDDGEVVGGRPVPPPEHEVVDDARDGPVEAVLEADAGAASVEAQRRRPAGRRALRPLRGGQAAAGAGVGAAGAVAVRGRGGGPDLGPGAPARIDAPRGLERGERRPIGLGPLGLAQDRAVPVDPERRDVGHLPALVLATGPLGIEILDPQAERRAGRAGEQPREQCGPEIPEMQRPGRGGGEAAVGAHNRHSRGRLVRSRSGR